MKRILSILIFCSSALAFGQITFYKQFSNNGYDFGEGITQTEDSSYLITGSSSSFNNGPAQAFLLKVDSLGNFKWSRNYGGSESDAGKRVMYIKDDGILIAGYTNSFGNGAYDFYLTKTDTDGNQLWEKTFGTTSWEKVNDAALTRDSGVIMIGETLNTLDGESDIYIVRTDKNGVELWSRQIGGIGEDVANVIEQLDDSTFAVGGKTYVEDSLKYKALVFAIHENNTILWMDTIGPNGNYVINDMSFNETTNNIALVGAVVFPNGETGVIEDKCTKEGVLNFENYGNTASIQYYSGITPIGQSDRFSTVVSFDNQYSYGGIDLSFNQNYAYLGWENGLASVNYEGDELFGQIITCSDFGAIGVGSIVRANNGGSSLFIIKINENGTSFNVDDSLTIHSIVSVQNITLENEINIYPNPVNSSLTIEFDNSENYTAKIIDNSGRIVIEHSLKMSKNILVDELENGVYYIKLEDDNGQSVKTKKIVILH